MRSEFDCGECAIHTNGYCFLKCVHWCTGLECLYNYLLITLIRFCTISLRRLTTIWCFGVAAKKNHTPPNSCVVWCCRVRKDFCYLRDHRKSSQKPSETNKIHLAGGGFRRNSTLGFKWCFVYTLVWELKPEVRTSVHFEGREGVSSETNFVCFAGLLRTFAMAPKSARTFWGALVSDCFSAYAICKTAIFIWKPERSKKFVVMRMRACLDVTWLSYCNCRNFRTRFYLVYFELLAGSTKFSSTRKPCTLAVVCDTVLKLAVRK